MTTFARGVVLLIAVASRPVAAAEPAFEIVDRRANGPTDRIAVETTATQTIFTIRSGYDIGSARITRRGDAWPATVLVRFEKFKSLEGLRVSNGRVGFDGRLGFGDAQSDPKTPLRPLDKTGGLDESKTVEQVDAPIVPTPAGIEVRLPKPLLDSQSKSLDLHWVDAYRG